MLHTRRFERVDVEDYPRAGPHPGGGGGERGGLLASLGGLFRPLMTTGGIMLGCLAILVAFSVIFVWVSLFVSILTAPPPAEDFHMQEPVGGTTHGGDDDDDDEWKRREKEGEIKKLEERVAELESDLSGKEMKGRKSGPKGPQSSTGSSGKHVHPRPGPRIASNHKAAYVDPPPKDRYTNVDGIWTLNGRGLPGLREYPDLETVKERYENIEKHKIEIVFWECCGYLGGTTRKGDYIKNCPVECFWSSNEERQSVADGVYFHVPSHGRFPSSKPDGQYWVAGSLEGETYYRKLGSGEFMDNFDLEMTYRMDSEIPAPYCSRAEYNFMAPPKPKTQSAPAMYVASNCNPPSGRDKIVAEMMKYMKIDSYGRCLHNKEFPKSSDNFLKWNMMKEYKFYLAFENTKSIDYVTEKLFQPLDAGTVPIVIGPDNIDDFAPSDHSIINVEDFESPKELAEYLNYLDQHDEEYEKYLEWKKTGPQQSFWDVVDVNNIHSQCRLCLKIHDLKYGKPV